MDEDLAIINTNTRNEKIKIASIATQRLKITIFTITVTARGDSTTIAIGQC